mmetsp:Transcript_35489/g.89181  ORF Transcript_35489/g.89181 Transcript_35489/m.89181 type:complete len:232 (-) Transcript_35489:1276-1971(-)
MAHQTQSASAVHSQAECFARIRRCLRPAASRRHSASDPAHHRHRPSRLQLREPSKLPLLRSSRRQPPPAQPPPVHLLPPPPRPHCRSPRPRPRPPLRLLPTPTRHHDQRRVRPRNHHRPAAVCPARSPLRLRRIHCHPRRARAHRRRRDLPPDAALVEPPPARPRSHPRCVALRRRLRRHRSPLLPLPPRPGVVASAADWSSSSWRDVPVVVRNWYSYPVAPLRPTPDPCS